MSAIPRGKVIPLSVGRRLVVEFLHHAKKVPSLPLSRECRIPDLIDARVQRSRPFSWLAIFMKAYGLAAQKHPELRRAFLPYPYPRLYEHPHSVASILIEREWQGEQVVIPAKIRAPETTSLEAIDGHLTNYRNQEVWSVPSFRQILRLGRMPKLLRRFAFWSSLNFSGGKRAKRMGTFHLSSLGNYGVEQHHPLTPLTTYFTFGPIQPDGRVNIKIVYDHRVMDGRCVARILVDLEKILNTTVLNELLAAAKFRDTIAHFKDEWHADSDATAGQLLAR